MKAYIRTDGDRHPYCRVGWYWKVFEDLFNKENLSDNYRKRMLTLKAHDEKQSGKKFAG